ncbi:MAG: hypothetical protein RSG57_02650, partial [Christensenellaceae bacterium]
DCMGKMKCFDKQVYVGKGDPDFGTLIKGGYDNYQRGIYYRCSNCNKEYSLDELIIQTYRKQREEKAMRKDKK